METARSRFLRYVTYYTTSDEHTGASPSTERQKDLGRVLLAELTALGLTAGRMDSAGNVIATLPASPGVTAPVVALIAHMDTAPDAPGENVKPRVVRYEHTAALDPKTADKVLQITEEIVARDKLTTLMVTHNMKHAIQYGNRLIMMDAGKVVVDIRGEEKKNLTVRDLLEKFKIDNDRMLLS